MPQTAFFIHWLSQTQWNMKVFTSTLNCIRSKYLTDVSQTELAFKLFKSMLPALCNVQNYFKNRTERSLLKSKTEDDSDLM